MSFKDTPPQLAIVDIGLIDADPDHVRQNVPEDGLKGLANAIAKLGLIHPIVVRPGAGGRYVVVAGERRRQAAVLAGEQQVPVLIRACSADELVDVRVFENLGLGVRSALEPRDMANAIQAIANRFESPEAAAEFFGRPPTWLAQATAAANLSEKVTALLESGKISSTGAAVQLEKLAKRNESKAESLIEQIEQMPEGEKVSKKVVDEVLQEARPRAKKKPDPMPAPVAADAPLHDETVASPALAESTVADATPPWETGQAPAIEPEVVFAKVSSPSRVNPGKVKRVAELLGLSDEDEEVVLARLIDEFLALKNA